MDEDYFSLDLTNDDEDKDWLNTKLEKKLSVKDQVNHWFKEFFYGKTMDYITSIQEECETTTHRKAEMDTFGLDVKY